MLREESVIECTIPRRQEYFSADRSMSVVPLAIALTVSFMSAITLLGISAENYAHGTQIVLLYIGGLIGTPIIIYFYLPVFAELRSMSVYEVIGPYSGTIGRHRAIDSETVTVTLLGRKIVRELAPLIPGTVLIAIHRFFQYLEKRFGVRARLVASIGNFLQLMLYTGVVLFAPSLALEATTGLSGDINVLLIGLICTFYSTVGGIKAVLVTDVFQGLLMFAGVGCVLAVASIELEGGLSNVWSISQKGGRIDFFE